MEYNNNKLKWPIWIAFILIGIIFIALFIVLARPIMSPDVWWHMVYGKIVLQTGKLTADHTLFTWTLSSNEDIYVSWLGQVIVHIVYENFNQYGLLVLRYLIYILLMVLYIIFARQMRVGRHPFSYVIIIIGISFSIGALLVKPEIFSILLMSIVVWLYYSIRAAGDIAWRRVYLFPVLMVLWVNIHGAFFISSIFFAATVIGEFINIRYSPERSMSSRLRRHYIFAMLLTVIAVSINPYGINYPINLISNIISQNVVSMDKVVGFKPTYEFNSAPLYLLDYLILAMIVFVFLLLQRFKGRQADWVSIISFVVYCMIFVQIVRLTYFLAPVFVFSSLELLSKRENSLAWPKSRYGRIAIVVIGIFVVFVVSSRAVVPYMNLLQQPKKYFEEVIALDSHFMIKESEYIANNVEGTRVGNTYNDGGVLIFNLWPDKRVIIDTRAFPFGEWMHEFDQFEISDSVSFESYLNKWDADVWAINYTHLNLFKNFVESSGWRLAFAGPIGGVFIPDDSDDQETYISDAIDNMSNTLRISHALISAVLINDLVLANRLYRSAINNLDLNDEDTQQFIEEIKNMIDGYSAFYANDYFIASQHLSNKGRFFHTLDKAVESYKLLGQQMAEKNDYVNMRKYVLKGFMLKSEHDLAEIYDLALADWLFRKHGLSVEAELNDVYHWKDLAELIVSYTNNPEAENYSFAIDNARHMLNGTFQFVPTM